MKKNLTDPKAESKQLSDDELDKVSGGGQDLGYCDANNTKY